MAIFLLIYIVICLIWFIWAGILSYLVLRFRYPDKAGILHLIIFGVVSALIFVVSAIFIARADWTTIPEFFKGTVV